jgi:hypothetical protein
MSAVSGLSFSSVEYPKPGAGYPFGILKYRIWGLEYAFSIFRVAGCFLFAALS